MFEGLFRRDTRKKINRGVKKLVVSMNCINDLVTHDDSRSSLPGPNRMPLIFQDVRWDMRMSLSEYIRTGRITVESVRVLGRDLLKFRRLVTHEARKHQRGSVLPYSSLPTLLGACAKANAACQKLYVALVSQENQRHEKDPLFEDARSLRTALLRIDRSVGRSAELQELNLWLNTAPSTVWGDPIQVQRLARIYVLELLPDQTWDVRYRSKAPGHPLIFVAELGRFPTSDDLEYLSHEIGADVSFFVAATLPQWRLVWQFPAGIA